MKNFIAKAITLLVLISSTMNFAFSAQEPFEKITNVEMGEALLEKYFVNPESLLTSDPYRAYWILQQLRMMGDVGWTEKIGWALEICVAAGPLKVEELLERYGKLEAFRSRHWSSFPGMELAEEASSGALTGYPDNLLALQLACRTEGRSLYELQKVVDALWRSLAGGFDFKLNFCDHVTSSLGNGICESREFEKEMSRTERTLNDLRTKISSKQGMLLDQSFANGLAFFEERPTEERIFHRDHHSYRESITTQIEELVEFYASLITGEIVAKDLDYAEIENLMEQTLNEIFGLFEEFEFGYPAAISAGQVATAQNLWEEYVKTTAEFAYSVDASLTKRDYEAIFISTRLDQLRALLASLQSDLGGESVSPKVR